MPSKGKGETRLSGKGVGMFTLSMSDEEYDDVYFGGKGKGNGRGNSRRIRSTGKGGGRKTNPKGRDGNIMKCYTPGCNSIHHLRRNCPMGQGRGQPSHRGPPPPTTTTTAISYVDRFEDLYMTTTYEEDICRPCLSDQTGGYSEETDNPDIEYIFMTTDDTPAGPPTVLGPP